MASPHILRRWQRVHTWSSLACTLFLLMACVTGLPLIFHAEIDALLIAAPVAPKLPASVPERPLDALVDAAHARYPSQQVKFFYWDDATPHSVTVAMAPPGHDEQQHIVTIDARTVAVLGEPQRGSRLMDALLELHESLFAGLPGTLFLGVIGLLFVLAIGSGVVLYAPFARNRPFGSVRTQSRRVRWLDIHNVLGIITTAWLLVVGATGVMNTLAIPLFGLWEAQEMPALMARQAASTDKSGTISVQSVVDASRRALPGATLTSVMYPDADGDLPRHYLVWAHGGSSLTSHIFTPVLVDAASEQVVLAKPFPWYLHALEVSRPLHFGDYGGLLLKILWALLDAIAIVVLTSGLYLWILRRKSTKTRDRSEAVS